MCVILGFRGYVDGIFALLGYYAALSGSSVAKFILGFLFFLDFLALEDGTDGLSRNVGTELPLNAA
jgi:hypothetical protein